MITPFLVIPLSRSVVPFPSPFFKNNNKILSNLSSIVIWVQSSEFLRNFRTADQNGFADAWEEIHRSGPPPPPALLDHRLPPPQFQPTLEGKLPIFTYS